MTTEDPTQTYHYNIKPGETPEQARQGEPTSVTKRWIIKINDREWTLTATRYFERSGSQSKPFWRIWESGDNRRDHDGDVNINQPFDAEGPVKVGVNWPAKGTQDLQDTLRFKRDLGEAVQAATEAKQIIEREAEEA